MAKPSANPSERAQGTHPTSASFPTLLRVSGRSKSIDALLTDAIAAGMPIVLPNAMLPTLKPGDGEHGLIDDATALDPSLATEVSKTAMPTPLPGTSYAGLTPAQRHAYITWSHQPHEPAPPAFQQLYLANLEARFLEANFRQAVFDRLLELSEAPTWAKQIALHRAYLLACWLAQDGQRLAEWISGRAVPTELLGIALGLQAIIDTPLTAAELGTTIATWQLGARLPTNLLKLRLDSLTAILGQPPLAYALTQLDDHIIAPRPWRTTHRGLRILIPQPDLRPILEASLRDLLTVADVNAANRAPVSNLGALDSNEAAPPTQQEEQPSLEDLGWRLILEFSSNRSEYFDYVLVQAQKLAGYSQLMDEDRRIIYRIIFRKSEMRRFWRIWDYVHGWAATRVYLNGDELEKWKVWPYSQYLK